MSTAPIPWFYSAHDARIQGLSLGSGANAFMDQSAPPIAVNFEKVEASLAALLSLKRRDMKTMQELFAAREQPDHA